MGTFIILFVVLINEFVKYKYWSKYDSEFLWFLIVLVSKFPQELKNKNEEVLEQLPTLKNLTKQDCSRLSGGERKQVSLAMALINKPELIIFDEPLTGVSPKNLNDIILQIKKLKDAGMSILLVEHRVKNVFDIADKVIVLKLGKVYKENLLTIEQTNEVMVWRRE